MRKFSFLPILVLLFSLSSIAISDAVIKEFRAEPGLNKVFLSWKVSLETDVKGYKLLRGFDPAELQNLEFINATSDAIPPGDTKKYEFIDQSVFKYDGRSYYYQIVVLNNNGEAITTSEVREVSPQISAVRHTWGSIKAMFR